MAVRRALTIAALVLVTVTAASCTEAQSPPAAPAPGSATSTSAAAPAARSGIDPRWTGFDDSDGNWRVLVREIGEDRQRLDLQPADESFVFPNECPGCNHSEATVALTVYERGGYDPAAVRTGESSPSRGRRAISSRRAGRPARSWPGSTHRTHGPRPRAEVR